jgi:hypothetical protein
MREIKKNNIVRYWSYNRHFEVGIFTYDLDNPEHVNILEVMKETRGVYQTKEDAEMAARLAKPIRVDTGINGQGYWI